jgi:hypothetical protein
METQDRGLGLQNNPKEGYLPGVHPNKNIQTSNTRETAGLAAGTEPQLPDANPDNTPPEELTEELTDEDIQVVWDEKN